MEPRAVEHPFDVFGGTSHLQTIRHAFDILGGNKGVRALTGATSATVSMWKKKGRFPANQAHTIEAALAHRGYSIQPEILGQKHHKSNSEEL